MKVVITGSTGLIGEALIPALEAGGHTAIRMVRATISNAETIAWDPAAGTIDASRLEGVDAVIHLAGYPIAKRWNAERKALVCESRAAGTRLLAEKLAGLENPPAALLSSSAIGYYGVATGDTEVTEASPPGAGFVTDVCVAWESATKAAEDAGLRVARMRTGLVLSRDGGFLARLLVPFRLGLGGQVGDGRQYWSWISIEDAVAAILHLLEAPTIAGAVNLTAPNPVTSREFAKVLGGVLNRPALLPVPRIAVKAAFGREMAEEAILGGSRVLPAALLDAGFEFRRPELEGALRSILTGN